MKTRIFLLLLMPLLLAVGLTAFTKLRADDKPVPITGGLVSGTLSKDWAIRIYRGITFAAPPVGNLRWKAPQAVVPLSDVRKCNRQEGRYFREYQLPG